MKDFTISVPASTANIGPCFDSAGAALNLYLTLQVSEADNWEIEQHSELLPDETNYEENFIYQIAKQTAERHNKQLPACKVIITSDIPLARGLGSSASAVIAGIELANQACELSLSTEEKLHYGTEIEGHPDNVAPALLGEMVISVKTSDHEIDWIQLSDLNLDVIVYIPNIELKTEEARNVLPANYSRDSATTASSISNILIASLLKGDYNLAGKMMEKDLFHEPYRANLIPNYKNIKKEAKSFGAYGTVISGAGPTMISFVPKGEGQAIAEHMKTVYKDYQVNMLEVDRVGVQVTQSLKRAAE
ncbi:homoserine kinase [Virgibacillus profundi]|uniref:Homoserine kinase n=1 Tax=Virgibacillus profundi TaxID=2024555 RepID=A0A2A2IH97_9BACI|nr:homoserine kinase [Virgibacillus profundi]PAV30473.1 homoserine kinase [Virgibacillus profundi]PXY54645.1 homoserine kinase [Virgibacillus profundi]